MISIFYRVFKTFTSHRAARFANVRRMLQLQSWICLCRLILLDFAKSINLYSQVNNNKKEMWPAARTDNSPTKLATLRQKDRQKYTNLMW